MGRNINFDEMIDRKQTCCEKCRTDNIEQFKEFDIDCYIFNNGICYYEFECKNCGYNNKTKIQITIYKR